MRGTAYAGAISSPSLPCTKSTAAVSWSTRKASGSRSCSEAHASELSSTAEAPSVSGVELPAVIVAPSPLPKTGLSFASDSTVESGRRLESRSSPRNGVTWSSKKPASYAAARCWCDAAASSSCSSRPTRHSSAVSAACSPIESLVRGSPFCGIASPMSVGRICASAVSRDRDVARGVDLHQLLAELVADRDRRVRRRVGAAADAGLDHAQRDLVGDVERRLQPGAAGLLEVDPRGLARRAWSPAPTRGPG